MRVILCNAGRGGPLAGAGLQVDMEGVGRCVGLGRDPLAAVPGDSGAGC